MMRICRRVTFEKPFNQPVIESKTIFYFGLIIVWIGVSITPPSKSPTLPPLFFPSCPLNVLSQPRLFTQCLLCIGFFVKTRPKSQIFWWAPKILKFLIFHHNLSFKSNQIFTKNSPIWIFSYDRAKFSKK